MFRETQAWFGSGQIKNPDEHPSLTDKARHRKRQVESERRQQLFQLGCDYDEQYVNGDEENCARDQPTLPAQKMLQPGRIGVGKAVARRRILYGRPALRTLRVSRQTKEVVSAMSAEMLCAVCHDRSIVTPRGDAQKELTVCEEPGIAARAKARGSGRKSCYS